MFVQGTQEHLKTQYFYRCQNSLNSHHRNIAQTQDGDSNWKSNLMSWSFIQLKCDSSSARLQKEVCKLSSNSEVNQ